MVTSVSNSDMTWSIMLCQLYTCNNIFYFPVEQSDNFAPSHKRSNDSNVVVHVPAHWQIGPLLDDIAVHEMKIYNTVEWFRKTLCTVYNVHMFRKR